MSSSEAVRQLQMVWPPSRLRSPPAIVVPSGYALRTFQPGDEARFFEIMRLSGWSDWNEKRLGPLLPRIVSEGWFLAVRAETDDIVATAMALRDSTDLHPSGGELGWVGSDPAHRGLGLGGAVCAAVTTRLIEAGFEDIHLYTEDFRLPALKTYLKLGYVPFLYAPDMANRWETINALLPWSGAR